MHVNLHKTSFFLNDNDFALYTFFSESHDKFKCIKDRHFMNRTNIAMLLVFILRMNFFRLIQMRHGAEKSA